MNNQILCPHCRKSIPLSDAISHEIREEFRRKAADYAKQKDLEFQEKKRELERQFEAEQEEKRKEIEEKTRTKLQEQMKVQLESSKTESQDLKKHNQDLQKQLLELTKTMRDLQTQMTQKDLEVEKKLFEEQQKIKSETQKQIEEEYKFKFLEQQKKLEDTQKALEDARRKSEQGSQQLQGEVLELEIENALKSNFPHDEVRPVAKGTRGGDIVHIVKNNSGRAIGTIIWELKRTKSWSDGWISKLKDDQRNSHAEAAVILSDVIPQDIENFGQKDGVWVGSYGCLLGIAHSLRHHLNEIALLRQASEGKSGKMELLYNYIYGSDFRHRVEAMVEAFQNMQQEIEREKRFFALKWAREEKNIRKVIDSTFGLRGDLESITGKELGNSQELEMLSDGSVDAEETEQEQLL